jgi:hypothetical protein
MTEQKYSTRFLLRFYFPLIICYLLLTFFSACSPSEGQKEPLDTANVKVEMKTVRFDQLVFAIDTNNIAKGTLDLRSAHPNFSDTYFGELIGFGGNGEQVFFDGMHHFLTYKDYVSLYDTVQAHFPDTKKIDEDLLKLFKNIKHYYPEENLGKVYYFISGLNFWSAVTVDSAIGIGLDMYLGKDYPFYAAVQIPDYELINRHPDLIPIHAAKSFFEATFPFNYSGKSLMEMMIYKGKELYFTEHVVRTASDASIMGYSQEKNDWCKENAALIYHFLINQKLLYSTSWQKILPLVNDGPTTAGMPNESPGNTGSWLGWQMVRAYMQEHPTTSLQQLMQLDIPAQQFLRESRYKP